MKSFSRATRASIVTPFAVAGVLALLSTACTTIRSSDLRTSGMSAEMSVVANGTGTTQVSATLHVDSNETDFVDLSPGDVLQVTAGTQSQPLARSNGFGTVGYGATLTGLDGDGTSYTIAFNRSGDTSAPSSVVQLPSAFTITAPTAVGSYSRARNDVAVAYGPGGSSDAVGYTVDGSCVGTFSANLGGDPGSFTIPRSELAQGAGVPETGACPVTITITRTRQGHLDPHYGAGGAITAVQTRSVTFNSTP